MKQALLLTWLAGFLCLCPSFSQNSKSADRLEKKQTRSDWKLTSKQPMKKHHIAKAPKGVKVHEDMGGAREYAKVGGPKRALVLIQHDSCRYSRMTKQELFLNKGLSNFFTSHKYSLVVFDARMTQEEMEEEFPENDIVFEFSYNGGLECLDVILAPMPAIIRFPAYLIVKFSGNNDPTMAIVDGHLGYLKAWELKEFLN